MKNKILPFLAWFFGSLCFGLFFIILFLNATELDCTHQADNSYNCQIRSLLFGKYQVNERNVDNIIDIVMEEDSCTDGCGYRAEFVTTSGQQEPLSEVWTDRGPVADEINAIAPQMDSGAEHFTYRKEPAWWVLFLVGGLTLMSLVLSPLILLRDKNNWTN